MKRSFLLHLNEVTSMDGNLRWGRATGSHKDARNLFESVIDWH
jgi:hypothetical protein